MRWNPAESLPKFDKTSLEAFRRIRCPCFTVPNVGPDLTSRKPEAYGQLRARGVAQSFLWMERATTCSMHMMSIRKL